MRIWSWLRTGGQEEEYESQECQPYVLDSSRKSGKIQSFNFRVLKVSLLIKVNQTHKWQFHVQLYQQGISSDHLGM